MRKAKFQKQLSIQLSPEHFEQIKMITDKEQISMAQWVREALAEALKNIPDDRQNL